METSTSPVRADLPALWRNVMLFVAIGKAGVAGAGLALAMLGVADLASVLGLKSILNGVRIDHVFDLAALTGGIIGAAFRLAWAIAAR